MDARLILSPHVSSGEHSGMITAKTVWSGVGVQDFEPLLNVIIEFFHRTRVIFSKNVPYYSLLRVEIGKPYKILPSFHKIP